MITTVRDIPFDAPNVIVGRFFAPEEKTTQGLTRFTEDEESDREACFTDEVEAKVVKPRGRRPSRPTEGLETK